MDMATHITKTCGRAFFYLYNIRHIRKYVISECTEKLIHAFNITSRLDYCNNSAPKYLIDLISVLPPSHYDLRRNNEGILLSTPKPFTKVTMGDRSSMAAALRL
ncbi:unnamed protein product [Porites evermanni]|uniref:Uncharacterized protein n=1 Tax=Porites evermanni TaxID=104178 RepID=A0ABN8SH76_9CNID|nr:unnamed protein product [Porites evermanni]